MNQIAKPKVIEIPETAPTYGAWAFFVKARDNYTCQKCSASGERVELHAHHKSQLEKDKLLISNGETLCLQCHMQTHGRKGIGRAVRVWQPKSVELTISFSSVAKLLGISANSLHNFIIEEKANQEFNYQKMREIAPYKRFLRKVMSFERKKAVINTEVKLERIPKQILKLVP